MSYKKLLVLTVLSCVIVTSYGHGRLVEPPSRGSMWRYGFDTPKNYNDNQLYCGGKSVQWEQNGGKCGVCGDNWADPQPRAHERGGTYGTGPIARTYAQGQIIDISVQITASHMGWFEFRLCPHNDPTTPVDQSCLDQHLLVLTDGVTRVSGINEAKFYNYQVQLPADITCSQCVLQWKYNTGNSWGTSPDGTGCLGCGPQEQFYGCADVTINPSQNDESTVAVTPTTSTESTSTTTMAPSITQSLTTPSLTELQSTQSPPVITQTTSTSVQPESTILQTMTTTSQPIASTIPIDGLNCHPVEAFEDLPGMDYWCKTSCAKGFCPPTHCSCDTDEPSSNHTTPQCSSAGEFKDYPGMDEWCEINCAAGYCPETHCSCQSINTSIPIDCFPVEAYEGLAGMVYWCKTNCANGFCPPTHCTCEPRSNQTTHQCLSAGEYKDHPGMDEWCEINCAAGHCPESHCSCNDNANNDNYNENEEMQRVCHATGIQAIVPGMHAWCENNCAVGYCPETHCACELVPSRKKRDASLEPKEMIVEKGIKNSCTSTKDWIKEKGLQLAEQWCTTRCSRQFFHKKCSTRCIC